MSYSQATQGIERDLEEGVKDSGFKPLNGQEIQDSKADSLVPPPSRS